MMAEEEMFEDGVLAQNLFKSQNETVKFEDCRTCAFAFNAFFKHIYDDVDPNNPNEIISTDDLLSGVLRDNILDVDLESAFTKNIVDTEIQNSEGFAPTEESNLEKSRKFKMLVMLLLELNTFLISMMSSDIPVELIEVKEGTSVMKETYRRLLGAIQSLSEEEGMSFVQKLFGIPTSTVFHLLDKWKDYGNFFSDWYRSMEKTCEEVRSQVKPVEDKYPALTNRLHLNFIKSCDSLIHYKERNSFNYDWIDCKTELSNKFKDDFLRYAQKFAHIVKAREYRIRPMKKLKVIGGWIDLDKKHCRYVKFRREDQSWKFVMVEKIIRFEDPTTKNIYLVFKEVNLERKWLKSTAGLLDFCVARYVEENDSADEEYLFIENNTELFALETLNDGYVIDKNPAMCDCLRIKVYV